MLEKQIDNDEQEVIALLNSEELDWGVWKKVKNTFKKGWNKFTKKTKKAYNRVKHHVKKINPHKHLKKIGHGA